MSDKELLEAGVQLRQYFAEKARERDVTIKPIVRDDRTTILTNRLYEEEACNRLFHVVEGKQIKGLDAFTKMTGLDFEIELLCVSTLFDGAYFPMLWDAYFQWLHERVDARAIVDKLNSTTEWR
jgi:hypothetical protein